MRRLMLVNIADEPRCPGIEPQLFDDPLHGTGAVVIVYRPDRLVDVYHQPGVRLDPAAYAVGAGLGRMIERPLDDLRFEIGCRSTSSAPAFRRWPDTYRWTAAIDLGDDLDAPDGITMRSGWARTASRH